MEITKSRLRIIGGHLYHNLAHKIRFRMGYVSSLKGATHQGKSLERSLDYIDEVFTDYLQYAGVGPDALAGRRVLEIGPGDNLGVALKFLAAGCSQVVCLDKFFARRNEAQQLLIYRAMRERLSGIERKRFAESVNLEEGFIPNPERLQYLYGAGIEGARDLLSPESFDYIISRAVLMEISDSDAAFASMDWLLKPGGYLIHKIAPLRDYEMFRSHGYNPLEFLTIPEWLYRQMVSDCGGPNRRLVTYYRHKMVELGYAATIHIVNLVGSHLKLPPGGVTLTPEMAGYDRAAALVRDIRPRLEPVFGHLEDTDLMVEDTFLVARKPDASPTTTWTHGISTAAVG